MVNIIQKILKMLKGLTIYQTGQSLFSKPKVNQVYLEGYSMGSRGRVFHIAENTGVLKQKNLQSRNYFRGCSTINVEKGSSW